MARRIQQKQLKPIRPVLLCEGQTELFYFKHLAALNAADQRFQLDIRRALIPMNIIDIERVVKREAIDCYFVCVFDLDVTRDDKSQRDAFLRLEKEYTNSSHVLLCCSMPSIEYWFLLHFEDTHAHLSSKQVLERLIKHLPNFSKERQFLENPQWVKKLEAQRASAEKRAQVGNKTGSYTELFKVFQ